MNFLKLYQKIDDSLTYLWSSVCNEKKLLRKNIKKKEILLVDIGANVGNYVEFVNKNFTIKTLYCFEPQAELIKNLEEISYVKNMHIFPYALSNLEKIKRFYTYHVSSQSSFYKNVKGFDALQKIKKTQYIKTKVFDNIFNKNQTIDLCKIDAEGEDFNILKGMKKNLKKGNIKLLKIEMNFLNMRSGINYTYLDVLNFLKKFNYNLISVSKIKYKNNELFLIDAFFKKIINKST
jgi:FkbM family methyltransferase|tara:strand:+ start:1769 stop:2473 length:705 start_codon:yes stop_codon:yes gene_type:complete